MKLIWEEKAWSDYTYWQTQDKKTLRRINLLIRDIQRNVYKGIGEPEPLRHNYSGWWSRRIDGTNIVVYKVDNDYIIASCKGHYED